MRVELTSANRRQTQDEFIAEVVRYAADLKPLIRRCDHTRRSRQNSIEAGAPIAVRNKLDAVANKLFFIVRQDD